MAAVLAFDVYGTLIDTSGVTAELGTIVGDRASDFARLWRDKQLEYSFRRGLMQRFEDFSVCVRDALEFTAQSLDCRLGAGEREALLAAYRRLPPFDDALTGLAALADDGRFELYAFSNGARSTVEHLLDGAGIGHYFRRIVSVEECRSFKPDPAVYRHFLKVAGAAADSAWLVSGNAFDVIGARSIGMGGIWVRRSLEAVFDPWDVAPSLTVANISGIAAALADT